MIGRPIEFVDEQGRARGVTADIVKLMEERTGVSFQFVPYQDWQVMFKDFTNGQLDMVAHLADTPERKQMASFTQDFWPLRWTLASTTNMPTVTQVNQLAGKRIAIKQEYKIIPYLQQNFPEIKIIKIAKQTEGFDMLHAGEADFMIDSLFAIGSALRQPEHINFRMHLPVDMPTYPTMFAIRKEWPQLVTIMDKRLAHLNRARSRTNYQSLVYP